MGRRQLRVRRHRLRGRRRRSRRSRRSARTCRSSKWIIAIDAGGDIADAILARRDPRPRPRARRGRARRAPRVRHPGGRLHLHLHLRHDRPAEGLRAAAPQLPLGARHDQRARAARGRGRHRLPLPAARARVRAADPARRVRHRRRRSPTSAATRSRSSPSSCRCTRRTCRRCRASSRSSSRSRQRRRSRRPVIAAISDLGGKIQDLEHQGEPVPQELLDRWNAPIEGDEQGRSLAQIAQFVQGLFGGNLREAVTGAAPIAPEILRFFYGAGVPVMEGYGMTETATVATTSTPDAPQVRLRRPAAAGRRGEDRRGRRDPHQGREHLQRLLEERRRELRLDRRRLAAHRRRRQGRRGRLRLHHRPQEGHHHHRGRQEPHAGEPRERPQADAAGSARPSCTATAGRSRSCSSRSTRRRWCRGRRPRASRTPPPPRSPSTRRSSRSIQAELDKANEKYAQVEQVKKFFILDHDLSQETGELTPTLKVKRNVVNEKYAGRFDALYEG